LVESITNTFYGMERPEFRQIIRMSKSGWKNNTGGSSTIVDATGQAIGLQGALGGQGPLT